MAASLTDHTNRDAATAPKGRTRWLDRPGVALFVGVGGAGMRALAEVLLDAGWRLSGSDETTLPPALAAREMSLHLGHAATVLPDDVELVIHTAAVPPENVELAEAYRRELPTLSYPQALGQLSRERTTVCVAGTHGKSTTTALTAHLLEVGGLRPGAIVGAESLHRQRNGWLGTGPHLVLESCEYQRHFLETVPATAAILGIEPDHFDCYPDFAQAIEAYRDFAHTIPDSGSLVMPAESEAVWRIVEQTPARLITFGIDSPAEWSATAIETTSAGTTFELQEFGRRAGRVRTRLYGRHNVANALAAVALATDQGVSRRDVIAGLESFPGIKRRFETIASDSRLILIDDYAHHPTAVAATIAAARTVFPGRRILCAFQPHQISRTEQLCEDFSRSLSAADRIWIAPVFTARESNRELAVLWSKRLAEGTNAAGGTATATDSLDRIVSSMEDEVRHGDVLITMGAGDIDRTHHEFIGRLFRDSDRG